MKANTVRYLLFTLFTVLLLGGCAEKVAPLTIKERAVFVAELLEDDPSCNPLRKRLAASVERAEIEVIYQDAKKTSCLKRDV